MKLSFLLARVTGADIQSIFVVLRQPDSVARHNVISVHKVRSHGLGTSAVTRLFDARMNAHVPAVSGVPCVLRLAQQGPRGAATRSAQSVTSYGPSRSQRRPPEPDQGGAQKFAALRRCMHIRRTRDFDALEYTAHVELEVRRSFLSSLWW